MDVFLFQREDTTIGLSGIHLFANSNVWNNNYKEFLHPQKDATNDVDRETLSFLAVLNKEANKKHLSTVNVRRFL
jgi:ribosomal protein L20